MRRRKMAVSVCFIVIVALFAFGLSGCSSKKTDDIISTGDMKQIYEETISPNKEYAEKEEDIVNYTVEIHQNKENMVFVNAKSNSDFFEPLQYEVECDTSITESDVDIEWTKLMGNPNPTEADDQFCIAYVSISENGELLDKRKISFINGRMEIIEQGMKKEGI